MGGCAVRLSTAVVASLDAATLVGRFVGPRPGLDVFADGGFSGDFGNNVGCCKSVISSGRGGSSGRGCSPKALTSAASTPAAHDLLFHVDQDMQQMRRPVVVLSARLAIAIASSPERRCVSQFADDHNRSGGSCIAIWMVAWTRPCSHTTTSAGSNDSRPA
jgi:hypothetical protein